MNKEKDLTNQQFGKWTVLFRNTAKEQEVKKEKGYKTIFWHCRCECGTEQDIIQSNLIGNKTTQCRKHGKTPSNFQDLTGRVFGRLTVLERNCTLGKDNWKVFWNCRCDCGTEVPVESIKLKIGHTTSCGCWQGNLSPLATPSKNSFKVNFSEFFKKNKPIIHTLLI